MFIPKDVHHKNLSCLRKWDCESVYFLESFYSRLNFFLRGKLFPIPLCTHPPSFTTKMTFRLAEIPCCTFERWNNIFKLVSCQRLLMLARYCWSDVIIEENNRLIFQPALFFGQSRPEGGSNVHRYAVGVMSSLAMLIAFSTLQPSLSASRLCFLLPIGVFEQEWWLLTYTNAHSPWCLKRTGS